MESRCASHYRIATTFGEREADAACRVLSVLGEATIERLRGNPLSAHALLHATVVWAVLLGYWTSARDHTEAGELGRTRTQYIRDGFAHAEPSMLLAPVADLLAECAPDVMALAWASVATRT